MQILTFSLLMILMNKIKKYIFWSLTKKLKEKFDNNYPFFDLFFQKSIYNILILSKRNIPDDSVGTYALSEIKKLHFAKSGQKP